MKLAKIGATLASLLLVLFIGFLSFRSGKFSPKAATTTSPPIAFADVSSSYWAYKEIQAVVQKAWMSGYLISTRFYFKPANNITRAELAVIMAKITNSYYDNPIPSFKDVPRTNPNYKAIEGCKKANIVFGYTDGTFRPDQKATRAELAVMISRAKNLTALTFQQFLSDVPESYWASKEIYADWNKGYLNVCQAGDGNEVLPKFCPDRLLTRAETAYFIYNPFIGYLSPSFSDNFNNLNNSRVLYTKSNLTSGEINLEPSDQTYHPECKYFQDPSPGCNEMEDTHAPLTVLGLSEWTNYSVSVKMRTLKQLRTNYVPPSPLVNAWEVGWILFRYQDPNNFYYFIHKREWGPIEVGRVANGVQTTLPIYANVGDIPPLIIGENAPFHTYKISVKDIKDGTGYKTNIKIYYDGKLIADKYDYVEDQSLVKHVVIPSGKVGLYNEDARVHFDNLVVTPL